MKNNLYEICGYGTGLWLTNVACLVFIYKKTNKINGTSIKSNKHVILDPCAETWWGGIEIN